MSPAVAPTVAVALIGLAGTIVTALAMVLASRVRARREHDDPLVSIAGDLGNVRARVDDHEHRLRRIERDRHP